MAVSGYKNPYLEDLADASKYFSQIGRFQLLSREKELQLFKAYHCSGKKSPAIRKEIAESNVRFVIRIAKQYMGSGLQLPDLIQEGNIGLLKAIGHYDHRKGVRFISYAVWWIRQAIAEAVQEQTRLIHIPANRVELANKANRISRNYFTYHGKEIPEKELRKLGIDAEKITHESGIVSLDQELSGGLDEDPEHRTYHDIVHENGDFTDEIAHLRLRAALDKAFESYPAIFSNEKTSQELERDVQILKMRFGINGYPPMTLNEIGKMFNLSRERIRQIEKKAKARFRAVLTGFARSGQGIERQELSDIVSD